MSDIKQKILAEFEEEFKVLKETDLHYYNPFLSDFKQFLSQAIDRVEEESKKRLTNVLFSKLPTGTPACVDRPDKR